MSPLSPPPIIEAHGIVRCDSRAGTTLLAATDFSLAAGQRIALMGPSGAGKSVFLRSLALLDPLDGGRIEWHGQPIERATIPLFRKSVAYVRQRAAVLDGTVEDNLRYPFSLSVYHGLRFDRTRAARLAERAGRAHDFLDKRASELSGGEAQIAALIRVLQLDPEVLLLDEPTASLDPESARAIEALVADWFEACPDKRASIWVSHDPAQAARVSNRQLTMRAGHLGETAEQIQ
ncbi:MAG TPA: ATP-binding cassette domain-containing protein [Trinickia sp.]|uniref:ABC transporter ATP-binding protein n=1 Tax=Trinickia sp. TaxID=2571163 RepID=UPI002B56ED7F|nr:ATP-binding cassette domain-containing protein [Trinickia sp.]HTI18626.1 ATP-binding cassette domain-containing protein [Trinickia sp.]